MPLNNPYMPILVSALGTDHSWSGITATMTAGTNLTFGRVVRIAATGKMVEAEAGASSDMPVIALPTGTIAADAAGEFLLLGFMRDDSWNWTPGGILYVSTSAGTLSQTASSGSGNQVQVVGVAISTDIIYFNPSLELVEIA